MESDPEKTTEVEVRFAAEAADRTRVELENRNLERRGEGWEQMRDAVGQVRDAVGSPEAVAVAAEELGLVAP